MNSLGNKDLFMWKVMLILRLLQNTDHTEHLSTEIKAYKKRAKFVQKYSSLDLIEMSQLESSESGQNLQIMAK